MQVAFYFKSGTMDSGKSIHLMIRHFSFMQKGKVCLVFKPKLDTRDGDCVKSRAMEHTLPADRIVAEDEEGAMFEMAKRVKPYCVFVDEVQFMPAHQIDELAKIVDVLGIPVMAYGLMTDFQTNFFSGSKRIIEIGANIEILESDCRYCTNPATFNMRLSNGVPVFSGEQVQVGGNESYKPVCRKCYNKAKEKSMQSCNQKVG